MAGANPRLTIAVCAFNEEANIAGLLQRLLDDPVAAEDAEVIVVSSASTDGTDVIVAAAAEFDGRLRLVREKVRKGKVAAVNLALAEGRGDLFLLVDADCLPAPGALAAALAPLADPAVGGVGTRNRPVNGDDTWTARAAALMWDLHHRVCLKAPVLGGDIVAFRRPATILDPTVGVNDDFLIEGALAAEGLSITYAPTAETLMRVPLTPAEFIRQRRRIHYGFFREQRAGTRTKSTQSAGRALPAAASLIKEEPGSTFALGLLVLLDTWAKVLARVDLLRGADHSAWAPSPSTKAPIQGP